MYCPTCGSEERQLSQFCRVCGTDMRAVRSSLEHLDEITASAATAREEIGRAIADKIREVSGARELERVAEDVLPQVEKFLESPEEKRLRRARAGVVTTVSGLGSVVVGLLLLLLSNRETALLVLGGIGLAILTFLIGLGLILNGIFFTLPRKQLTEPKPQPRPLDLNGSQTNELPEPPAPIAIASVTEHTTQHLRNK